MLKWSKQNNFTFFAWEIFQQSFPISACAYPETPAYSYEQFLRQTVNLQTCFPLFKMDDALEGLYEL